MNGRCSAPSAPHSPRAQRRSCTYVLGVVGVAQEGSEFPQDADHLCQMLELMGRDRFPPELCGSAVELASDDGTLLHFMPEQLKFWSLRDVLVDKYHFEQAMADEVRLCLRCGTGRVYEAPQVFATVWVGGWVGVLFDRI